jgi:hypothetical protein
MIGLASSCGDPGGDDNNDIPATCGNGEQDEGEACEPGETFGETCESLGLPAGELGCRADCSDFDRSMCGAPETCGTFDDGCGGTLDCGRCPVCELGCPDGYE